MRGHDYATQRPLPEKTFIRRASRAGFLIVAVELLLISSGIREAWTLWTQTMCGRPRGFKSIERILTDGSTAFMCSACCRGA
jgi:hypothetical protein